MSEDNTSLDGMLSDPTGPERQRFRDSDATLIVTWRTGVTAIAAVSLVAVALCFAPSNLLNTKINLLYRSSMHGAHSATLIEEHRRLSEPLFIKIPDQTGSHNLTRSTLVPNWICGPRHRPSDAVMLLRMYGPFNDAKRSTIRRYATQLQGMMDLWVLYDTSPARGAEAVEPEELQRMEADVRALQDQLKQEGSGHTFHVFVYNLDLEYRMFPTAAHRLKAFNVNLHTHGISVLSWWRTCGLHNWGDVDMDAGHIPLNPEYVWVVETDAGYSGNVTKFFDFYKHAKEDLIMSRTDPASHKWYSVKRARVKEYSGIPETMYRVKDNFVNRFSSRLLYHTDAAVKANFILFGEAFESTLCQSVFNDWCTYRHFKDDGFVADPNLLHYRTRIPAEDWQRYNTEKKYQNKWYHAVEEFKEHGRRGLLATTGAELE